MSTTIKEVFAVSKETYKDHDGNDKKTYVRIGTIFSNEKGENMKIDFLPVKPEEWYINIYPAREK